MIDQINTMAEQWFTWQWAMLWQSAVLIIIIAIVDRVIRNWAWPQLRYAMWLLILVKLILPPTLSSPVSVTSAIPTWVDRVQVTPVQTQAETPMQETSSQALVMPETVGFESVPTLEESVPVLENPVIVRTPLSWTIYAMVTWLFVALALALGLAIRLRHLRREHAMDQSHQVPDWFHEALEKAALEIGCVRLPRVVLSRHVLCPAVFGLFKPVLLVPEDQVIHMSPADARHILLHELAHIKRLDLWGHGLYMLLLMVYWFNPLLWLMRRHLQNLRELCCDATVARVLREHTPAYRETLLETAKSLLAQPVDPGLGLLGLFENSTWLVTRLQWLEKKTWRFRRVRIASVTLVVGVMLCCVLPMAVVAKQDYEFEGIALSLLEQALEQVIHTSWQAYKEGDIETMLGLTLSRNEAERKAFLTFYTQTQTTYSEAYWERPIHFVTHHEVSPGRYCVTWLAPVPGTEEYMPNQSTWRRQGDTFKCDVDLSYLVKAGSTNGHKVGQVFMRQQLSQWQHARGQALDELVAERHNCVQDNLLAVQRAVQLGVSVGDGYEAYQNEWLEKCVTLAPEQLHSAVIKDIQRGLTTLARHVQLSEPDPELDVSADIKQVEAMMAPAKVDSATENSKQKLNSQKEQSWVQYSHVLTLAKPKYEWWLAKPTQQLTIQQGDPLTIKWRIPEAMYKSLEFLAVGVVPEEVDVSENECYQWLANDIPITARKTVYGKAWPVSYALMEKPNKKAKPLTPGNYRIIVYGFKGGGGEGIGEWRVIINNNLECVAVAQLKVESGAGHEISGKMSPGRMLEIRNMLNDRMAREVNDGLKKDLSLMSRRWLFSDEVLPGDTLCEYYTVKPGDTLEKIGRQYKVPYQCLMKINGLRNASSLQAGRKLKVINGPFHAKLSRSTCKMDLYLQDMYVKTYNIGLGKPGRDIPTGQWVVAENRKLRRPQWTDPETGRLYRADDPDYPLGEGFISIKGILGDAVSRQGFGMYGTQNRAIIGQRTTNGTIAMLNPDFLEVLDLLKEETSIIEVRD